MFRVVWAGNPATPIDWTTESWLAHAYAERNSRQQPGTWLVTWCGRAIAAYAGGELVPLPVNCSLDVSDWVAALAA